MTVQDGLDDLQAARAGQVADHRLELDVHAFQRLLHMLHMAGGHGDVVLAQTQVVLQAPDRRGRHEPRMQQAMRMQRGQPLAVGHVGLASWQVAHLPAIDHQHRDAGGFQRPVEVQPVDAGRLQRHRTYPLRLQPADQLRNLVRHHAEDARRVPANGDVQPRAAYVDARSALIQHR
ncbi:hypothetical protein D3C72_1159690 [compost metagenome]